jgi:signal transduction histidine kinase
MCHGRRLATERAELAEHAEKRARTQAGAVRASARAARSTASAALSRRTTFLKLWPPSSGKSLWYAPQMIDPQLVSLAVHEFRTPASVVGGYLRMLQRDADPPLSERQRRMVDEAEKSCARLVAIVGELSDIGKLDSGAIALASQPIDLFTLVGEVAELVHEASDREVRLELRGPATGASVTGDGTRLRAAFDAIFRAILREKPGPATVVADRRTVVRDGRGAAVVVVADADRVQQAYDSPSGAFDDRRGGLGLALPLARRVIERHGGALWSPAGDEAAARGAALVSLPLTELTR